MNWILATSIIAYALGGLTSFETASCESVDIYKAWGRIPVLTICHRAQIADKVNS
jgi:hypothetical protein